MVGLDSLCTGSKEKNPCTSPSTYNLMLYVMLYLSLTASGGRRVTVSIIRYNNALSNSVAPVMIFLHIHSKSNMLITALPGTHGTSHSTTGLKMLP
jgi:hypothetical protein